MSEKDGTGIREGRQAIYLPMPALPERPSRTHLSFNTFARHTPPVVTGTIEDRLSFSKSLGWPDNEDTHNHYIKAPGTGFFIPPELEQFVPAIRQMIDDCYKNGYGSDGYCYLGVLQAVVHPKAGDDRSYIKGHRDIALGQMMKDGHIPNWHSYVVSDCLTTGFADYSFSEAEAAMLAESDEPDEAQRAILNRRGIQYKGEAPYDIVRFDSATSHAHANPSTPTRRTFLIASFVGPDAVIPVDFNNRWLEAVVKERGAQPPAGTLSISGC